MKKEERSRRSRESTAGYQDILEGIEEGYFEVNLAGNLTFFNDAMCRIADLPREELMGMNNREYTTPETAKKMYEAFNEIYRTGRSTKIMDFEIIRKDGIRRNLELSASLILNANGDPTGYRGIVRDTTERKRAEQELARFKLGIEKSGEAVFLTDAEGTIQYINPAFERIYGFNEHDAIGQTPRILKSDKHPQDMYKQFWETILSKQVVVGELINKTKDGRLIHVEGSANPILDKKGDIVGFLAIQRDITERKRRLDEIQKRTEDVSLINDINNALNSGASLKDVIELLSARIRAMYSALGVTGAAVFLLDDSRERLVMQNLALGGKAIHRIEKLIGRPLPHFRISCMAGSLHKQVMEEGQTRILNTRSAIHQWMREFVTDAWVSNATMRNQLKKLAPQVRKLLGIESTVIVPLRSGHGMVGLMEISSASQFTESDIHRLEMLSNQLTVAIQRKQTEDALRESEERYRSIVDSSPMGMHSYRLNEKNQLIFERANPAADKILGVDHAQFIGKNIEEAFPSATGTDIPEIYRRLAREGGFWQSEDVIYKDEQISGAFEVHAFQISPHKVSALFLDITDRKRDEEALRLTQFSVDHASDAAFWMGRDARFVYVNEAACRSLGYSCEELLAMTVHDIDPNFPREKWPDHWEELQREGSLTFESLHRKKNGRQIPVEVTANYVAYGGVEYNCAFARDITERLAAEKALRESERTLREFHDNAIEGIFRTTTDGKVLYANEAMATIFGYGSVEEFMQVNVFDLYPDDGIREQVLSELGSKDYLQNLELHLRRKDNSDVWVQENATMIRDEHGGVLWIEGFLSDITSRKKAEEALRDREEELRQAQKMEAVGHLAGGIAHDFNNVLTQISAATELLQTNLEHKPGKRYMDIILGAVERGKSVTERILKFSRRTKPQYESFSIAVLLGDIVHVLRHTLPKSVRVNLANHDQDFSVWGDKGQLHQVFMNLCLNAADAMPEGGDLTLHLRPVREHELRQYGDQSDSDYVCVEVSDTGVGMDRDIMEKMFNPFFTTKKAGKGTGLGLPIIYKILDEHNGWVEADSQPGQGTTFTVGLRLTKQHSDQLATYYQEGSLAGAGEHILVVDDEPMLPVLLKEILESVNYVVSIAESGESAWQRLQESPGNIQLMITDLDMRNMGGRELVKKTRHMDTEIPIIVTSGYFDPDEVQELRNLGVQRFMNKPFKLEEVIQMVYEVLKT